MTLCSETSQLPMPTSNTFILLLAAIHRSCAFGTEVTTGTYTLQVQIPSLMVHSYYTKTFHYLRILICNILKDTPHNLLYLLYD